MSEQSLYYESFSSGYWCEADPKACRCRGSGWALSELDTFHKCPEHYKGQPHPETDYCTECGDGFEFSPLDCSRCGPAIRKDMDELPPPDPMPDDTTDDPEWKDVPW